ncbi:MAG: amylopullulanase [Clostridiales bacterium]|nr:amylopullulanase [Clostridiales bacterium]
MYKPSRALTILLALLLAFSLAAPAAQAQAPTLRVHYQNEDNRYEDLGLWFWGDVVTPSEQTGSWPGGRTVFAPENIQPEGAYLDIALEDSAAQVGVLVIDATGFKLTPEDLLIDLPGPQMREVWINNDLEVFYENPRDIPAGHLRVRYLSADGGYEGMGVWFWRDVATPSEQTGPWPAGATPMTAQEGPLGAYVDIALAPDAREVGFLFVNRDTGEQTADYLFSLDDGTRVVYLQEGDDAIRLSPYAPSEPVEAGFIPWQQMDALYATDSPLGATLHPDGSATLRLWAPTADQVEVLLSLPLHSSLILPDPFPMALNADHVWEITLDEGLTGLASHRGLFYQFRVIRGEDSRLVLDPYAQSLAAWDSTAGEVVPKAAIIDAAAIGPQLDYADIPGFVDREDAIIYEVHIRDFTSSPAIADELAAPFGTFAAFIERLDYLRDLGVTHIQLLPVNSFYHVNEFDRERSLEYAAENQNYNWGYDPMSYFALSGMYATDPMNPETRVKEFKQLVDEIHSRGMGVILDVVYNHTARIELLEDIQPNYYYFMDRNGRPKGSFGGGQVGSTHLMTRRLIIDSLAYLSDTYKVDGFRFDMMGSLDLDTITQGYERVSALNPNTLWLGEGWRTFNGDAGESVTPADQDAMDRTDAVAVFSDEVRNELKSGFGMEGQPRFLTGGRRPISLLFNNIRAQPGNVRGDDPGDIVQYIEAHDNLTLHDVIALSIKKDPKDHQEEILRRQRLGNALLLTHQGLIFLHAGQEYGRTKQFLHPDYITRVDTPPAKSTFMADESGAPFEYPYFIHDSYDASDAVNAFDWEKALNSPQHRLTLDYTRGLIALRKSTDAFSYANLAEVEELVQSILSPSIETVDLLLAFAATSMQTGDTYLVAINADAQPRTLDLTDYAFDLGRLEVLVDGQQAGTQAIAAPVDVTLLPAQANDWLLGALEIQPLTAVVIRAWE